jgi:CDP-glucose 4,6-dehydratase
MGVGYRNRGLPPIILRIKTDASRCFEINGSDPEVLSGYLLLAQKLYEEGAAYAEGWNFGPNDEDAKPVQWIVESLTKAWGEGASWALDGGDHPHEAHYLKLDCSKAKARLDWYPKWHLEDALVAIIKWHRAYQDSKDMRAFSLDQIRQYVNGC